MSLKISDDYINKSRELLDTVKLQENNESFDKLTRILNSNGVKQEELFRNAREIREKNWGNKLFIRASLEFGNRCSYACNFCGMSVLNRKLKRYQMSIEEMKYMVDHIAKIGIGQLHLVAGEYRRESIVDLCEVIKYAKECDLDITVVIGRRSKEDYYQLFEAGARRYIMKFETSNEDLYYKSKGHTKLVDRIAHLLILRDIGFKIGTGTIIGLPGSSMKDWINDLSLLQKISPDMASASVFSPNEDSIYSSEPPGNPETTLNFISLLRTHLSDPSPMIPCSSSLGSDGQYRGLMAGANVISYHSTPEEYIDGFSSYKAKERIKVKMDYIHCLADKANLQVARYE